MTVTVNTIGFGGKGLKEFVGLLRDASVSKVIDTRLRPDGQLSAYARRRDLEFFLESYESIEYEHNPDLAPTPEILDAYRRTKDWEQYERRFAQLIAEREMMQTLRSSLGDHESVALLCSEAGPQKCHRRLVAEHFAECTSEIAVRHLE